MTLPELRVLAEKAKAWRPDVCRGSCPGHQSGTSEHEEADLVECGGCEPCDSCDACLGAQRAAEDIAELVDEAALELEQVWWCPGHSEYVQPDAVTYEERHDPRAGGCGGRVELLGNRRIECATAATRIASYFGDCAPVAAFEAGVREMCNG